MSEGEARAGGPERIALDVLDNLLEGCQVVDPCFRYVYVNAAAARHGRTTPERLLGRTMPEAFPGIDATQMFAALRRCMEERVAGAMENEFTFPDGSRSWFQLRFEPVPEGVAILSVDVSDRVRGEQALHRARRAEEQLEASQRLEAVGRLAGGVAHDFNNLLSVIVTYTSFALDQLREDDPARADLEEVRKAGQRAAMLTRQLLAFSRKQLLSPDVLSLNRVVSGIEGMLRRLLGEDIDIVVRLADDLAAVVADPGQLEQVVMNLAVNARDAMPAGGTLTLETRNVELDADYAAQHAGVEPGPFVLLAVSDTGTGMEPSVREHIFEPFFTTKPRGKGTGLGLSTVYGIVKQSGGNVWVYTEPGRGTTFKIYLPRVDDPPAEVQPRAIAEPSRGRETVLVVEDEDAVRRLAERILRQAGYAVLSAPNGADALRLCGATGARVDLLVTDVVMPGMSGRELAEHLGRLCPGLRVLYMSGYTDEAIVHHGVLDPGTAFVSKPFTAPDLARRVRQVLDA